MAAVLSHLTLGLGMVPQIAGVFQPHVRKNGRGREHGKVPGPGLVTLIEARTHVLLDACNPRPSRIAHISSNTCSCSCMLSVILHILR
jgi:hypothetical protein